MYQVLLSLKNLIRIGGLMRARNIGLLMGMEFLIGITKFFNLLIITITEHTATTRQKS